MTRKGRRIVFVVSGLVVIGVAVGLILAAFQDNLVFFHTPSEVAEKSLPLDRRFRLGGLVEEGSVRRDGLLTHFRITDNVASVPVVYEGILPDLFREGQGVVAQGALDGASTFVATEVLAKHDENYMPPEVAEAIKATGQWKGKD
jgi:cytochrome c-type biogenesis protein CcmE